MATVDFLLSSSPPRFAGCQTFTMSSSPIFPSPNDLARVRPQSRSGLQTMPMPSFATSYHMTAVSSLNEQPSTKAVSEAIDHPVIESGNQIKTVRKPKVVAKFVEGFEGVVKKPRKSRAKKVDVDSEGNAIPAEKAPRKPRAKKDSLDGQSKLPKGRVTKASAGSRAGKAGRKKKTEVASSHFTTVEIDNIDPFDISNNSENNLLLQAAIKRRKNWTPPKITAKPLDFITPTVIGEDDIVDNDSPKGNQKTITALLANFGYNGSDGKSSIELSKSRPESKKRKSIELDDTNEIPPEPKPIKAKAVKKKPRTITELATSAYAVDANQGELEPLASPILKYCTRMDPSIEVVAKETADGFKIPPKPRSRSPAKPSKRAKGKKGKAENPILLLSPQSALKHVEKQEFVFGTASQLAREDSPTLLRDLHQAMQASNQIEDGFFVDIESLSPSKSAAASDGGTEAYIARRNLWTAASEGIDGSFTHIETIDMSESPHVSVSTDKSDSTSTKQDGNPAPTPTLVFTDNEWHDLEADEKSLDKVNDVVTLPPPMVDRPVKSASVSEMTKIPAKSKEVKKSSKATSISSKTRAKDVIPSKLNPVADKPDYNSYPTAKLAKEIASYRFKPVKNRDQMILLLEKCWEGRQQVAASKSLTGNQSEPPASDSNKPLVLRQTPKKPRKKKESPLPEEIDDSDSPITPSPPRRRNKIRTPTPVLELSVSDNPDESLILSPTSQQLELHKHITRAITSVPPSQSPNNPTWHEKILLYDPIVLEDLAAWLNTGALQKVGWDGEVSPQEVKRWCLEKSICCLWRENLRGEARSRY